MTFPIPGVLLGLDAITTRRATTGADAEGIPESTYTTIYSGRGTLGTPTAQDFIDAAQRTTKIDQVLALPLTVDLRNEDEVVCTRGTFVVVSVAKRRLYLRAILRKIST